MKKGKEQVLNSASLEFIWGTQTCPAGRRFAVIHAATLCGFFKNMTGLVKVKINTAREKRRGPIPVSDPRTHCVSVRLNIEELNKLDSNRRNMARGEYLRCAALDKLQPILPSINKDAWSQLSTVASNLNQIARKLNSIDTDITRSEIDNLKDELCKLRASLVGAKL